jgi:cyclophilin family peptidyl-prolyl cis-trans isomerase/HEAT repeat protein
MHLRKRYVIPVLVFGIHAAARAQELPRGVSAREVTLYAQLLAMTDTRRLDTALVDRALASIWAPMRSAATLAIGQVGAEPGMAGASRLRALLKDRDVMVASNAAYALGLLRDTAAIADLAAALALDHQVAREAAWALGEIGAPARSAITAGLRPEREHDTAIQLLLAASKLRPIPLAEIRPYLGASHPSVVWAASYAIARTRTPGGVHDLIDLEASPTLRARPQNPERAFEMASPYVDSLTGNQRTRAEIARGLARSAAGDSLGPRAFAILARLVGDVDPHVRVNAVRSLGTYGAVAKPSIIYATHDYDPNVRIAAAQSLGTVLSKDTAGFRSLWLADTSIVYRSSLLASAARAGLRPSELSEWAASDDWRLRAAVAAAGGDTLDRAFAISRASPLTRDRDPRVREAAYGALAPPVTMPLEDSVHTLLLNGLRDQDFYVRATVIGSLADRPSVVDLVAVLASYSQAGHDSANDARLAAIQYVAALWKKDSTALNATWRAQLAGTPVPADPLERAAGKTIPVWSKWGNPAATSRPSAWYEQIVRTVVMPTLAGKTLKATINTVRGPIHLELFGANAPITAWNFLSLARSGFYRNTRFHRVVPNFVAQDGDPRDDGNGGPGYAIRDEMNPRRYERGAVGMALSGPDTGGSQYFITHSPQPHLDGHYTVFGRVVRGYDVLDKLVQGDLITSVDPK